MIKKSFRQSYQVKLVSSTNANDAVARFTRFTGNTTHKLRFSVMSNSCNSDGLLLDLSNKTSFPIAYVYAAQEWVIYQLILPSIILFGLATNLSFIRTVIYSPSLYTCTYRYLTSLAAADSVFLLIYSVSHIVYYHIDPLRRTLPAAVYAFQFSFFCCSVGTVTLVSLERFLAICYPIKHHLIKGTRRTNKLIGCVWFVSACSSLLVVFLLKDVTYCIIWPSSIFDASYPNQLTTTIESDRWAFQLLLSIWFVFCLCLLVLNIIIYIKIYLAVRKRKQTNIGQNVSPDEQLHQLAIMLIVNGTVFFLFLTLQMVIGLHALLTDYFDVRYPGMLIILNAIDKVSFGLNASINPVIYLITNKRYRHAFRQTFILADCRGKDVVINTIPFSNQL